MRPRREEVEVGTIAYAIIAVATAIVVFFVGESTRRSGASEPHKAGAPEFVKVFESTGC